MSYLDLYMPLWTFSLNWPFEYQTLWNTVCQWQCIGFECKKEMKWSDTDLPWRASTDVWVQTAPRWHPVLWCHHPPSPRLRHLQQSTGHLFIGQNWRLNNQFVRPFEMMFGLTKGGKLFIVNTHIIWAHQNIESIVYHWLRAMQCLR